MKQFLAFLLLFGSLFSSAQDCTFLPNGIYKAEYDTLASIFKRTDPEVIYEIFNDTCYVIKNNIRTSYNIVKFSGCGFSFKKTIPIDTSSFTNLQKVLQRHDEQWFYKIKKVEGKIYHFEIIIDLHVSNQPGRFIMVKKL